jgi:hypothetical protein
MANKCINKRILGHKGNAHQSNIEILSHSSQNGIIKNTTTNVGEDEGKKDPYTLLMGM